MHWMIQSSLYQDRDIQKLVTVLEKCDIPHSIVEIVPFRYDVDAPAVDGAVIAMGAYTMSKIARAQGWCPGVFHNDNFDFTIWRAHYDKLCLNHDARICAFQDVSDPGAPFFVRPTGDNKAFAGMVVKSFDEFAEWQQRVVAIGDESPTLKPGLQVLVAPLRPILFERRYFIVDGEIITSSRYKTGSRVIYSDVPDEEADAFVRMIVKRFVPDRAFVVDVAGTPDGLRIIEINCLNSAGFYACDIGKVVMALEGMGY